MKNKLAYLFAFFALPVLANTPPVITNVRAEQRKDTKLVDIYYDAADADNDALKVRIEISDNDGAKYFVPAFTLTGDIGEGITPGTGKHIVWDAGADWDGEYSDQMRVKVYAIDAQGFPGMEWGNEVPPGGFLMGQDGGAEGSGESRHVNIPWSYWLSKYEITAGQFCDFLNVAYTAGVIDKQARMLAAKSELCCPVRAQLCPLGDYQFIRWNVSKYEIVNAKTNMPAVVTWYGAMAFARYYGYDLPTTAEWEKAARGPDNDDQDEHLNYPWGNDISDAYANGDNRYDDPRILKPVGYYNGNQTPVGPDTINGYGLYDIISGVAEWTRSCSSEVNYETYPQLEDLDALVNSVDSLDEQRVIRGRGRDPICYRQSSSPDRSFVKDGGWSDSPRYFYGIRVVRRIIPYGK